jgi:hypothetical protein
MFGCFASQAASGTHYPKLELTTTALPYVGNTEQAIEHKQENRRYRKQPEANWICGNCRRLIASHPGDSF